MSITANHLEAIRSANDVIGSALYRLEYGTLFRQSGLRRLIVDFVGVTDSPTIRHDLGDVVKVEEQGLYLHVGRFGGDTFDSHTYVSITDHWKTTNSGDILVCSVNEEKWCLGNQEIQKGDIYQVATPKRRYPETEAEIEKLSDNTFNELLREMRQRIGLRTGLKQTVDQFKHGFKGGAFMGLGLWALVGTYATGLGSTLADISSKGMPEIIGVLIVLSSSLAGQRILRTIRETDATAAVVNHFLTSDISKWARQIEIITKSEEGSVAFPACCTVGPRI